MGPFTLEAEELRGLRDNIRRNVNALEVCWSCEVVCEATAEKVNGRRLWLCPGCYDEHQKRSRAVLTQALSARAN